MSETMDEIAGLKTKTTTVPIDQIRPYGRNARTHSPEQIEQLVRSIREYGWTNPILVDASGEIIAGHGRYAAAQRLGLTKVPIIRLAHLTETQKRGYVLADNQLALQSGWDEDLLRAELGELRGLHYDLSLIGFDAPELAKLTTPPLVSGKTDPDEIPDPPADPVTRLGDLWLLGDHRLICADSSDPSMVAMLMNDERARLMATDPPYGVSHVATKNGIPRSGFADMAERWEHIKNDDLQDQALQYFLTTIFKTAADIALTEDAAWYLWHAHLTQGFFAAAAAAAAVLLHRQIIWVKPGFVLTRSGMYHWRHEPCFYGWRQGHPPPWYGPKNQDTVWAIGRDGDAVHPTQKPVALWDAPIDNHTLPGEIVYEPFSGSGSQIIAAEQTCRRCYAIELSPQYVDVAIRRWQNFTGRRAVHAETRQEFPP